MRYKDLLNTNDILGLLVNKLNFAPKQMGKSIFFLCPFHNDTSPSCSFEPNRKIFTCFSCGFKASDIFVFWSQYKKISKEEAAEEIANLGYFPLSLLQEQKIQEQKNKDKDSYLLSLITSIYQHNLFTKPGKEILTYLQNNRQLNQELINNFSLGCTINNRQLSDLLFQQKNDNFSSNDLLSTNLIRITDNNRTCDFFQAKQLIIPLTSPEGKIIAFAARRIGEIPAGEGKYKYLPSYQHYHKSSLLYNYHIAKKTRQEECYLVEGFFDVISLVKKGVENCVALLGTNLSEKQIKLLINLQKSIILFLDGDRAGQEATISIAIKLLVHEVDCEIIKNNYKSDPDELCCQHDSETVKNILKNRENPYLFILNYYFNKWQIKENPQRTNRFISEIASIFQKFKIDVRNFLITKISLLVNWDKEEIEPYFIQWKFPSLVTQRSQVAYCQELINDKEKKIIELCAKERSHWLFVFTIKRNHFFLNKKNREKYYNVYNYYITSPQNRSFREQLSAQNDDGLNSKKNNLVAYIEKNKSISILFQEIDNIKQFILNYE